MEGVLPPGKAASLEEGSEATVVPSVVASQPNLPAWVVKVFPRLRRALMVLSQLLPRE